MTHNRSITPSWLDPDSRSVEFPDVELAMQEPNGLLAVGGALSEDWLLTAYRHGVFPWYGPGQPILWWAPNPRLVLYPADLHVSRSLAKVIRNGGFMLTLDTAFSEVISGCAESRPGQSGTWITPEMRKAYIDLHHSGHAHSVECWYGGELVGGLYGVAIGRVFFGESMFARRSNASKVAFVALVRQLQRWGFRLIDCQVYTDHLASLGARGITRQTFSEILSHECDRPGPVAGWQFDENSSDLSPQGRRSPPG